MFSYCSRNWLNVAKGLASTEEAKDFKLDLLKDEIVLLEKNLAGNHLSTGCCHNDLQYGNIMMDEETRSITFIVSTKFFIHQCSDEKLRGQIQFTK